MPSIFEPGRKEELLRRLEALDPGAKPAWGAFNAARMLKHCAGALQMGMGELRVAPRKSALRIFPVNKFVIHVAPWPKGVPTAPELIPRVDEEFLPARRELITSLERFVSRGASAKFEPHPAFGEISPADWGALMHRHLDHHWRQFGV